MSDKLALGFAEGECIGTGTNGEHCCYIDGVRCAFLRENVAGRRFACGLFLKYESWGAMNASSEYEAVGSHWLSIGRNFNYCETFSPLLCCRMEVNE